MRGLCSYIIIPSVVSVKFMNPVRLVFLDRSGSLNIHILYTSVSITFSSKCVILKY